MDPNELHFLYEPISQSEATTIMPRNLHITAPFRTKRIPAILRTHVRRPREEILPSTPRLWNAKRRIKQNRGLNREEWFAYKKDPRSYDWRSKVSPDVAEYLDQNPKLLPEEKGSVLNNPARWFSRPHHVPIEQRKQIYLPDFPVTFIRTPTLGPFYAAFQVPLWLNKLDMKSYLKNVYNVDVVHVRSYVTHGKKDHKPAHRPGSQGKAFRQPSKKRMTVQLVDPFDWPEETKDFTEWDKPEFWRSLKAQVDLNRRESKQWTSTNPNLEHRSTIAKQAKEILEGKASWKPTWTQIPSDVRVMKGIADVGNRTNTVSRLPARAGRHASLPPPVNAGGGVGMQGSATT